MLNHSIRAVAAAFLVGIVGVHLQASAADPDPGYGFVARGQAYVSTQFPPYTVGNLAPADPVVAQGVTSFFISNSVTGSTDRRGFFEDNINYSYYGVQGQVVNGNMLIGSHLITISKYNDLSGARATSDHMFYDTFSFAGNPGQVGKLTVTMTLDAVINSNVLTYMPGYARELLYSQVIDQSVSSPSSLPAPGDASSIGWLPVNQPDAYLNLAPRSYETLSQTTTKTYDVGAGSQMILGLALYGQLDTNPVADLYSSGYMTISISDGMSFTTASGLDYAAAPVPEASEIAIMLFGLSGVALITARRRNVARPNIVARRRPPSETSYS